MHSDSVKSKLILENNTNTDSIAIQITNLVHFDEKEKG